MKYMCLRMFGVGTGKALSGERTEGAVTKVKTCWWLKINTKPIRSSMMDGAKFPHIIYFSYNVDGATFTGKCYVNWNKRCPVVGERLIVCYEKERPAKYAVIV